MKSRRIISSFVFLKWTKLNCIPQCAIFDAREIENRFTTAKLLRRRWIVRKTRDNPFAALQFPLSLFAHKSLHPFSPPLPAPFPLFDSDALFVFLNLKMASDHWCPLLTSLAPLFLLLFCLPLAKIRKLGENSLRNIQCTSVEITHKRRGKLVFISVHFFPIGRSPWNNPLEY